MKTRQLIIGGLPGTAPDVIARLMSPHITEALAQTLVIDNRGGGAGILGAQIVATAPGDGYTALLVGGAGLTIVQNLTKKRPYDPIRDFTPVTLVRCAARDRVHPCCPSNRDELISSPSRNPRTPFPSPASSRSTISLSDVKTAPPVSP